jgi:plasmid stability protein
MADGGLTLQIDEALAERLKARAEVAGQSVEDYARQALDQAAEAPGFNEAHAAYADEMDRICEETLRTGGIPWEQFRERLLNLGKPR